MLNYILIFVATLYDDFKRSYLRKTNEFDLLISSELDFGSRSLKI